jgi:hypothetical protein
VSLFKKQGLLWTGVAGGIAYSFQRLYSCRRVCPDKSEPVDHITLNFSNVRNSNPWLALSDPGRVETPREFQCTRFQSRVACVAICMLTVHSAMTNC